MSDTKSHDFIVRLEGLQLSEQDQNRIAAAIQSVVMAELGKVDSAGGKTANATGAGGSLALLPVKWRGILYRPSASPNIAGLDKTLGVTER
jgi:hypothetical protein